MKSISRIHADTIAAAAQPAARSTPWTLIESLAVFAVCMSLFAFIQFGTSALADNDAYYHIKMGWLIRQQGLTPQFIWLPHTILRAEAFYDHHMLYHVYLSLFTGDGQEQTMIAGAKIASILMPSFACLAIWWLLRSQGVPWASIWAIGLFGLSEAFLYRMSMTRAQAASLLVLILGLHWLFRRRYSLLLPLGFIYVWLYNAFPLLLVVAGAYVVAALLVERRFEWRALVYPALGVVLGLMINPYFPQDLGFIAAHLAPKIGASATPVGNEWYPYTTWVLLQNSGFAIAVWLLGVLALGWRQQRIDLPTLTAFALSIVFGFLLFRSRRFIEYFPPFPLLFAALSIGPLISAWAAEHMRWQRLVPIAMLAVLVLPLAIMVPKARVAMSNTTASETFAGASHWLREHTPPGSLVFHTDWDEFPMLFFYNTSNVYTAGLDPTFMEHYDPDLFAEWVKITRGQVELPGAFIRSHFGAAYVLTDLQHDAFLGQAANDPRLKEVYRDQYTVVFAVSDE
jgi:hypothetical protein